MTFTRAYPVRFFWAGCAVGSARVRAPSGLQPASRQWFLQTARRWELEAHHLHLLGLAARALDEAAEADALIADGGLLIRQPSGRVAPNPAVAIRNNARLAFARLLRELDLDLEAPAETKRPPVLASIAGGRR